jgi:hypothetical protein
VTASPGAGDLSVAGTATAGGSALPPADEGFATPAEADHWIHALDPRPAIAGTMLVRSPRPHVAVVLEAVPHGRAVIFPGVDKLTGVLPVASVPALSAIDRVEVLGGGPVDPATLLDTGDFVRPQWRDDELVLTVMPAAGGRLVPFETRNPTPCCAAH